MLSVRYQPAQALAHLRQFLGTEHNDQNYQKNGQFYKAGHGRYPWGFCPGERFEESCKQLEVY